jgi:hypothetical protein
MQIDRRPPQYGETAITVGRQSVTKERLGNKILDLTPAPHPLVIRIRHFGRELERASGLAGRVSWRGCTCRGSTRGSAPGPSLGRPGYATRRAPP